MRTMANGGGPRTLSEVEPGDAVVVHFDDGAVTHLDRVDLVLAVSDVEGEEYIVYVCRGRLTCMHFAPAEPEGFGPLLAEANTVLATPWHFLDTNQRENLTRAMGTAVALGIENRVEEGRLVLRRSRAFARGECIRKAESVHLAAGFISAILITGVAWAVAPIDASAETFPTLADVWMLSLLGGPLGGLLAISLPRNGESHISPHATAGKSLLTGVMRIVVSIVTSLVVLLAVRAGLAATGLVEGEPGAGYVLVAIAGGFGSSWATNILRAVNTEQGEGAPAEPDAD